MNDFSNNITVTIHKIAHYQNCVASNPTDLKSNHSYINLHSLHNSHVHMMSLLQQASLEYGKILHSATGNIDITLLM